MIATTPGTLLQLMWLASPALPVGGFSYSEALEAAVESGRVGTEVEAGDWLMAQLQLGLARADLPVVAQAVVAWQARDLPRVEALDAWCRGTRESAELRAQAGQMGRSLVDWLRNGPQPLDRRVEGIGAAAAVPMWPVAFALAAVLAGADAEAACLAFAWGWAENQVQSAMKCVPLGQAAAQRVLARLAAAIPAVVLQALTLRTDEMQAHTPMLAILSAQHETQYSRLFRS